MSSIFQKCIVKAVHKPFNQPKSLALQPALVQTICLFSFNATVLCPCNSYLNFGACLNFTCAVVSLYESMALSSDFNTAWVFLYCSTYFSGLEFVEV